MNTETKHTPTPYGHSSPLPQLDSSGSIQGYRCMVVAGDDLVCETKLCSTEAEAIANAAFIVRACNSHAALVEALQLIRKRTVEVWGDHVSQADLISDPEIALIDKALESAQVTQ